MRLRLMLMLVVGVFTAAAYGQRGLPTRPVPGQMAPDVYADRLLNAPEWMEAGEISLEALRGKVVYVKFWSKYCLPCIQAIPVHNELKAKYGDRLVFLGVTPHTVEEAEAILEKHPSSMVVLSDAEHVTQWRYHPRGQGSGTLICPDGRVSRVSVDDIHLDEAMIEMALRNEYEDGPPVDMDGEILPHAVAKASMWGKPKGERRSLSGQDPYSMVQDAGFQLICRPGWENGKFLGSGSTDTYTWLNSPALWIIKSTVRVSGFEGFGRRTPANRVIGPDWLDERYFDFIYNLPGIETAVQQRMIESALETGMGVQFSREQREMDGYRLEWADASLRPEESEDFRSQWIGGHELEDGRHGTKVTHYTLEALGKRLEDWYGVPIVYGEDAVAYDFLIPSPAVCSLDEMKVYLLNTYGLRFVAEAVEVEVLVVRETRVIGDMGL